MVMNFEHFISTYTIQVFEQDNASIDVFEPIFERWFGRGWNHLANLNFFIIIIVIVDVITRRCDTLFSGHCDQEFEECYETEYIVDMY